MELATARFQSDMYLKRLRKVVSGVIDVDESTRLRHRDNDTRSGDNHHD